MTYELHEPTFDGTTAERWTEPDWESIAGSDPETVAGQFLLCEGGFPPETLDDLALPVVDEQLRLNRNALADAVYGADGLRTLDVSEATAEAVEERCLELLRDHFESMPETVEGVDELLLAWREHEAERFHEVEQKRHTDDEERYYEVRGERIETDEERPEKGW
mgnify:FL=1